MIQLKTIDELRLMKESARWFQNIRNVGKRN
jgi:hypothetical protein